MPGKNEKYLMIGFESNYHFWLLGNDEQPAAYIEVSIYSNEEHYGYKYDDIHVWAVNGLTFA